MHVLKEPLDLRFPSFCLIVPNTKVLGRRTKKVTAFQRMANASPAEVASKYAAAKAAKVDPKKVTSLLLIFLSICFTADQDRQHHLRGRHGAEGVLEE